MHEDDYAAPEPEGIRTMPIESLPTQPARSIPVDAETECETGGSEVTPADWEAALGFLEDGLRGNGRVSTRALNAHMERVVSAAKARALARMLRFYDVADENLPEGFRRPACTFTHHRASFFTPERYESFKRECEAATPEPSSDTSVRSAPRQEEQRMGRYITDALSDIYANDYSADQVAFDVHSARPRSSYENVDQLAVFWRSARHAETVAVEAKLRFTPQLVHQARNYCRFAHRVWIAVPVTTGPENAAADLQLEDPLLFEYVLEQGIGILACRRRPGSAYEVFPVHWPQRQTVDPVELDEFVQAYWDEFEAARLVSRRQPHAA